MSSDISNLCTTLNIEKLVIYFAGTCILITFDTSKRLVWADAGSFVVGIGMRLTSTTFIISIQNHVDWKTGGVATASNMFMRMIGSSLGAALLGGALSTQLNTYLTEKGESLG